MRDFDESEKPWIKRIGNNWILAGMIFAFSGLLVPFIIIRIVGSKYTVSGFEKLAPIGEYFGGISVGLLTFSSVIMVTAAIVMQKEELKLQRKELSRVTDEYALTNATMKRQQFESTFFNMVNLHQTILTNLKRSEVVGRELIANLYDEFNSKANKDYREYKFKHVLEDDEIEGIFHKVYPVLEKERLKDKLEEMYKTNEIITAEYRTLKYAIDDIDHTDDNLSYISHFASLRSIIEERLYINNKTLDIDVYLADEMLKFPEKYYSTTYDERLSDSFGFSDKDEWNNIKVTSYEEFYEELEYVFGHYFRNLYRIIKYINETDLIDDFSKKEFRGILRAQLSSDELMMLFYNVIYSGKGLRFKEQLKNKNFFDDHLIFERFVWFDDPIRLEEIK